MTNLLVMSVAAGLAAVCSAQEAGLEVKVRNPGGAWTDFVAGTPGSVIECAVFGRHSVGYGFASGQYEVRGDSLSGIAGGVTLPQRVSPFNFGPQTLAVYYEAPGFRLDIANDPGNAPVGILSVQRDPFSQTPGVFETADPALVLRFDVTAGNSSDLIHVRVPIERVRNGTMGLYDTAQSNRPRMTPDISVNGAWIYIGGDPCLGQHYEITTPEIEVMPGEDVSFTVTGTAFAQWYRAQGGGDVELLDQPGVEGTETPTLTLRNVRREDSGQYRVNVLCETLTATLRVVCPVDFNDDGFVDFFDVDAYLACFEGEACPAGKDADFNRDGFVDFLDAAAFVDAFEAGCAG